MSVRLISEAQTKKIYIMIELLWGIAYDTNKKINFGQHTQADIARHLNSCNH